MGIKVMKAPWTEAQVQALNHFQALVPVIGMHGYTCPHHSDTLLVAAPKGWTCPKCNYTQDWAHPVASIEA